jgi:hypothetical protein
MKKALGLMFGMLCFGLMAAPAPSWAEEGPFFRQSDQAAVYFQYLPNMYCHVQNTDQMAAYGGFEKVKVVPKLQMKGQQTGVCGWPNGFYRLNNEPNVYRLYASGAPEAWNLGSNICHVTNPEQMAAYGGFEKVKVVSPDSKLGVGRGPVQPCFTPGDNCAPAIANNASAAGVCDKLCADKGLKFAGNWSNDATHPPVAACIAKKSGSAVCGCAAK